ncbi:CMP-N-acetylneuraminate-beta-galactosamide-alpha-2,3-sialyltransferase 1-like [Neoarius graeffei]|uniref:CMP-N-acetylneuraminate-beta-galactosamide- alpha-2,3-sialyltransferase 1-like n=1 Tax=Neoarius graeffei TaxID=443677 RepID=UPI00298CDE5E|nr:CMP-N-acetylneuraminate-beta-galactosamide-alpha-2,3-sialyltransferase 1-like [Neoarius graeffei]XP_060771372.1 CMP-N-acetylneuraminate-beta-galactosamide-alpha-2,3-sialyltransferase 1-like [Neoarius graeffei]
MMKLKVWVISMPLCMVLIFLFVQITFRSGLYDFVDFGEPKMCACMSCVKEPQQDPWFMERYDGRVPIFMNRTNSKLSELTLNWWMHLQSSQTVGLSEVVEPLFSLFHDKEHYNDPSPDRCRTCAVVGNSANLKQSHYGAIIDAHDFVFRMNRGSTAGYERDVGTKITHRAIYPESAMDLENSTHLVLLPFKVLDLQWLISVFTTKNITRTYTAVKPTIKANKDKVMIINPEFMKYVYETWLKKQGKYPSTGFMMLMLALHICDQVSVFGFGADSDGRWYHYFDHWHQRLMNAGVHRGGVEYELILKLEQKERIKMYKGWS